MAPSEKVSRGELLGLAATLEESIADRGKALALQLKTSGRHNEADRLEELIGAGGESAKSTAAHAGALSDEPAMMEKERQRRVLAELGWHDPEVPSPLTLYRALAWASDVAERRFRLYGALAGRAEGDEVRALAEAFAQAELSRAAQLRRARRLAYRAERKSGQPDSPAAARSVGSPDELRYAAREIETQIAALLAALAVPRATRALAITQEILQALNGPLAAKAAPATPADPRLVVDALDEAFAFYDLVHSRATDEAVMERAQCLAQRTLERLQLLRAE